MSGLLLGGFRAARPIKQPFTRPEFSDDKAPLIGRFASSDHAQNQPRQLVATSSSPEGGLALCFLPTYLDSFPMSEETEANDSAVEKKQWPGCGNCGKPAIVFLGGNPVCIDCKYKHDMSQWMEFAQNATMLNFAAQEMDAIVGFGPPSPTIQIPRPPVPPINYNHQTVSVSGGTVGAINFGNVRDIQVNLQALAENGSPDIVESLTNLTDAILNANDTAEPVKNELLEQIATLRLRTPNLKSAKPVSLKLSFQQSKRVQERSVAPQVHGRR